MAGAGYVHYAREVCSYQAKILLILSPLHLSWLTQDVRDEGRDKMLAI